MQRTFLNTRAVFDDKTGVPTREHPDCDSTPVVKIYKHGTDALIETPTVSQKTDYYATGHYSYPLDYRLYERGEDYYDIVTSIFDSKTIVTDRRYFRWGMIDSGTGDSDEGYNYNLFEQFVSALEDNDDFCELLGHDTSNSDYRIFRGYTQLQGYSDFPCMTFVISGQGSLAGENIGSSRKTSLECIFWHPTNEMLIHKLNDMLISYISESSNYKGLRISSSDRVFYTYNAGFEQLVSPPDGRDAEENLYAIGARYTIRASLQ